MRIAVVLLNAFMLAAASPAALAEKGSPEPAKTEVPAAPAATDKAAEAVRPVAQVTIDEPRKSGLDQPLCTGE